MKKWMSWISLALIVAILMGAFAGCGQSAEAQNTENSALYFSLLLLFKNSNYFTGFPNSFLMPQNHPVDI